MWLWASTAGGNTPECMKLFDGKSGIGKFFVSKAEVKMEAASCTTTPDLPVGESPLPNQTSLLPAVPPAAAPTNSTPVKVEAHPSPVDSKPAGPTRPGAPQKREAPEGSQELPRKQQRTLAAFFKAEHS
eukprot:EG_transcript_20723